MGAPMSPPLIFPVFSRVLWNWPLGRFGATLGVLMSGGFRNVDFISALPDLLFVDVERIGELRTGQWEQERAERGRNEAPTTQVGAQLSRTAGAPGHDVAGEQHAIHESVAAIRCPQDLIFVRSG